MRVNCSTLDCLHVQILDGLHRLFPKLLFALQAFLIFTIIDAARRKQILTHPLVLLRLHIVLVPAILLAILIQILVFALLLRKYRVGLVYLHEWLSLVAGALRVGRHLDVPRIVKLSVIQLRVRVVVVSRVERRLLVVAHVHRLVWLKLLCVSLIQYIIRL